MLDGRQPPLSAVRKVSNWKEIHRHIQQRQRYSHFRDAAYFSNDKCFEQCEGKQQLITESDILFEEDKPVFNKRNPDKRHVTF